MTSNRGKLRVLISDDHAVVRRGLQQMIKEEFDQAVITEAATGQVAIDAVRKQKFDVAIMDLEFPDRPGLEVLKEVKLLCPTLPVVVLSIYPEEQFAMRTLKSGAAAYLTKESAPEELVLALRKVFAGGQYVSARLAEYLVGVVASGNEMLPHEKLTDRELEVLCFLGRGESLAKTADALALSSKTITSHRNRIFAKLNLKTNAELIQYTVNHRLFQ